MTSPNHNSKLRAALAFATAVSNVETGGNRCYQDSFACLGYDHDGDDEATSVESTNSPALGSSCASTSSLSPLRKGSGDAAFPTRRRGNRQANDVRQKLANAQESRRNVMSYRRRVCSDPSLASLVGGTSSPIQQDLDTVEESLIAMEKSLKLMQHSQKKTGRKTMKKTPQS